MIGFAVPNAMKSYLTALSLILYPLTVHADGSDPMPPPCKPDEPIAESAFVPIGGIEQWITINGERCAHPVLLFIHGGPGNPLTPYAESLYGAWTETFTLALWDQRGAGRTYGRNQAPGELTPERLDEVELTLERLVEDGVEVAQYLSRRLGKKKIILTGSSWGSVLGVHMARARPDLFYAYVGVAQLVHGRDNMAASYAAVRQRVEAAADGEALEVLETLGPPPWRDPRHFGRLRRLIRRYEAEDADPLAVWSPAPAYDTPEDRAAYDAGEEFSYVKFVGLGGDGMLWSIDLPGLGTAFEIPVFFVHGSGDLLTTPELARSYFDRISAPAKEFVLVPRTGHDPTRALIEAHFRVLKGRVLPLAK